MKKHNKIVLSNLKSKNYLDFSKFPKDHPLYTNSPTECGKMKSEREGYMIKYAVALRSKMYYLDISEKKKSDIEKVKGITNAVKLKLINGENYVDSILGQTLWVHNQTRIQVKNHELYTLQESKTALSADDTKRYITENTFYTRALGHWRNKM